MNLELLIPLVAATLVAILGWFVVNALGAKRDQRNKRRDVRLSFLLEAYRRLEAGACRGSVSGTDYGKGFESAIADVQLLGTVEQAQMAKEVAKAIASHAPDATVGPLLLSLRDALREELGLGALGEPPLHFRLLGAGQQQPDAAGEVRDDERQRGPRS